MHVDEMSGVAVVKRGGVTVAEHAGGLADRDRGLACTPLARFQIASVSKQFAAAAVLLLVRRSVLSLDDPVSRWLGTVPGDWAGMTIHHLLTHTAGLGQWTDFPALDIYRPIEPARELAIFEREPLLSAPGGGYRYSSPGYVLLAWIVEQAGQQPYPDFLADQVFGPLGMTTASAGDPLGGGMARGYRAGQPVPSFDLGVGAGAADVWCTIGDLMRWDEAVAGDELLPASLRETMLTAHVPTGSAAIEHNAAFTGYGYAWRTGTMSGRRAFCHAGDNPGYLALNAWLPDEQIMLAVLSNDESTDILRVAAELLALAT